RYLETSPHVLERWYRDIFLQMEATDVRDTRGGAEKERLFAQKEKDWLPFGYAKDYLDQMKHQSFWDHEFAKIADYDEQIRTRR
ncbi:MAG: pyridoxal-5'-phosphate-dependent protein subunit beta, partial [Bacillota bacterium]|nr:pyridoxal-5'-phosphate-dependent protein subunit beta [Bacillota bacterium]